MSAPYLPTYFFFFFNDTATTEIYTLSLHDALPIYVRRRAVRLEVADADRLRRHQVPARRSEEHTSELQSRGHLVCRLLLEKKKENPQPMRHVHASQTARAGGPLFCPCALQLF